MGEWDDNAILRYHKSDKTIVSKLSEDLCLGNQNNESSKLKRKAKLYDCSEEIHDDQIWILNSTKPNKKSTTTSITTTTTTPTTTSTIYPVWLYNEYTNSCLYAPEYKNEIPTYENCYDSDDYLWYIVDTAEGSYFKSKTNPNLCIRVSDYDRSKLEMGKCDDNAILRYRRNNKSIVSKFSTELCLGNENIDDNSTTRKIITLYDCSKGPHNDQIWLLSLSRPQKKTPTTTTITTTKNDSSSTPDSNDDYRCGKTFNNKSCGKGKCCSKYGYCGTSEDYCGEGCQSDYGRCNNGGRCGSEYGKCINDKRCCSKYGYCGTSEDYCGEGCQSEFGLCYSKNDRCGEKYSKCRDNKCCSKYGYCRKSSDYCGTGCQSKYGLCN